MVDSSDEQATIVRLKEQLKWTQKELRTVQDHLLTFLQRKPAPWWKLDNDVLLLIYEALLPPAPFLSLPLCPSPTASWYEDRRMRKSLTSVCKRWREAALPMLYQEVYLTRVSQVLAFAQTVQSDTSSVAPLVRAVHFTCLFIPNQLRSLVSKAAVKILKGCIHVSALNFTSSFLNHYLQGALFALSEDDEQFVSVLCNLAPKILVLRSEGRDVVQHFLKLHEVTHPLLLMSLFTALRSLTLPVSSEPWMRLAGTSLRFDYLEHLSIEITEEDVGPQITDMTKWVMPSLEQVSIEVLFYPRGSQAYAEALFALFEGVGSKIRELKFRFFLHFVRPDSTWGPPAPDLDDPTGVPDKYVPIAAAIERIVSLCPSLEYLSCPAICLDTLLQSLLARDQPVQLDMWGVPGNVRFIPGSRFLYPNIRVIDDALYNLPDLPRLLLRPLDVERSCPPPIVHHVYHVHIVQTCFAVFQLGSESWNEENLREGLQDVGRRVKIERFVSGLPEFDFDERVEYAYIVANDSNSSDSASDPGEDLEASSDAASASEDTESEATSYERDEYANYVLVEDEDRDSDYEESSGESTESEESINDSEEDLVDEQELLDMLSDHANLDMGTVAYLNFNYTGGI